MTLLRTPASLLALTLLALPLGAQDKSSAPAGPPLASFTSMRVAIVPVQAWRADSIGWSKAVNWAETRLALDSAITAELLDRGLGKKWAYATDVVRTAKRNPTYASDPYTLGVGRLRSVEIKADTPVPAGFADNLRTITALGDTRYALVPVELRAAGEGVVLRILLVDTRSRSLVWGGDLESPGGATMIAELATRVANLIIEP